MRLLFTALAIFLSGQLYAAALHDLLDSPHRTAEEKSRDTFRHPVETLTFFDVQPDMTVVEIWPGAGGWYTSILAPWLYDQGTYYAAQFPEDSEVAFYRRSVTRFKEKLTRHPEVYDHVRITALEPPAHTMIAPPGTVDRVLTFRNVHNWAKAGNSEAAFTSFFEALKPGGVLGVVEHRAPEVRPLSRQIETGYMSEGYVIEQAEKAGFKLQERSEINANPKDQANHPAGVWSLPPTLRQGDHNRQSYQAIGESDRMTLKFVKPE